MKKKKPKFKSEDKEREFWSGHDSTEYIEWGKAKRVTLSMSSRRCSRVRQALYDEDLARARQQTPSEKLKIALELSEVYFKLRKAIQTAGKRYTKS